MAECRNDLELQIRLADTRMPKLYGSCKSIDEASLEQSAELTWSVTRDGRMDINIAPAEQLVAAR
ncbi:hypothetical protein DYI37_02140 [Fulvimarina endophytica]|uniref:Uncharacterized protein n=2 Tax=Fulvimarina endophytica TaxID=2293836 RepID=A0A371XAQ6_9HYPH|nr:hypothetical protein DYI37_02140 [Fulvimarina endophytica]